LDVVRKQIARNVQVTAVMALFLALVSGLIARAYGLRDTDLWLLLCVNAMAATVSSANNVFERLLVCLDAQPRWFALSVVAFTGQVVFTVVLIHKSLVVVPLGVMVAGMILGALCLASMNILLSKLPPQSVMPDVHAQS
jgi:hypothetical protein